LLLWWKIICLCDKVFSVKPSPESSSNARAKNGRILVQTQQFPLQETPFAGLSLGPLEDEEAAATSKQEASSPEPEELTTPHGHGEVILARETAHRGGKTVIIVRGFAADIPDPAIAAWARQAKNQCACGGSVEDRSIILQGDIAPRVRDFFLSHGFRVRGVS
jgi:translation initiation factor 1